MKRFIKLLLCAFVLAGLFAGQAAAAARPQSEYFTISNYDVNINISENNIYDITETITVNFTEPRHGISREIPFQGDLYRQNRPNGHYRAAVTDISVEGFKYKVSRSGDNVVIQIGDAKALVEGEQVYKIHYKMNYGNDGEADFDEVYPNIIGPRWNTTIDRVNFSVTLPKEFDAKLVGFSMGGYGSSGYNPNELKFSVDGTTIAGYTTTTLYNYEALTLRVELPQGYFVVQDPRTTDWLIMGIIGLLSVGSVLLFFLYGRDEIPVKTVEFYAPEGMTPSEVGYIIDGSVDNRDVCSLVMYWADRGYLTIEDTGGGEFTLHKVKNMGNETRNFEQHMFNKLFKDGDSVTTGDLKYTFYTTVNSTKAMVGDSFAGTNRRVFTKVSSALMPLLSFFTALPVMMTVALNMYRDTFDFTTTLMITAVLGGLILVPVFFLIGTMRRWRGEKPTARVIKLFCFLFLCLLALVLFLVITESNLVPALPWIAALATVLIGLTSVFITKRTPKGVEWLGKIQGFRDFIQYAERDKLEALVEQNPSYFYNVLPFAWVLNVTDKWAKRFESIALEPPQWYYGYSGQFHPILFVGSLNHSMSAFQSQMTSTPPSRGGGGGGGFSGGGFSGGGGGGGGGGSW